MKFRECNKNREICASLLSYPLSQVQSVPQRRCSKGQDSSLQRLSADVSLRIRHHVASSAGFFSPGTCHQCTAELVFLQNLGNLVNEVSCLECPKSQLIT